MRTSRGAIAAAAVATGLAGYVTWPLRHRAEWARMLTERIPAHHDYWRERGRPVDGAVLYVALGDSAALGLGASHPSHGYVGLVAAEIQRVSGRPVRPRNLAVDGARVRTVIDEELRRMPASPDIVTLAIGGNDLWEFDGGRFASEFDELLGRLPAHTIVGEVPSFFPLPVYPRANTANRIIREAALRHDMPLAPVHDATARGGLPVAVYNAAGDLFHSNDRGHRAWASAFLPAVRACAWTLRIADARG